MTQILGLLDRESQITNINMLRALKENLDNIQCQKRDGNSKDN